MGGSEQQHGRVLPLLRQPDVVVRAVLLQVRRIVRLIRIPKVRAPCMPDRELVEAQHVHHADLHERRAVCCALRTHAARVVSGCNVHACGMHLSQYTAPAARGGPHAAAQHTSKAVPQCPGRRTSPIVGGFACSHMCHACAAPHRGGVRVHPHVSCMCGVGNEQGG